LFLLLLRKARKVAMDEKQRALNVIGVEDVNRKLDIEVDKALDPVDQDLNDLRSTLDRHLQRNNNLKVTCLFQQYRVTYWVNIAI